MFQSGKNITGYVYFIKMVRFLRKKSRHRMDIVDFSANVAYQI